jgi:hypothetical protein
VVVLLTLAACGTDSGARAGDPASDPAGSPSGTPIPTEIPAASGPVHTRGLVTVMDTGSPELCLGPVAESYPPQCGGPPRAGTGVTGAACSSTWATSAGASSR